MTTVAGVDYSTRAVHGAIVAGKQLRFVKQYDLGRFAEHDLEAIAEMLMDFRQRGADHIYMERPFFVPARVDKKTQKLRQGSTANTLKLHRVAAQVETLARMHKLPVNFVYPATWQSQLLTGIPGDTKERSLWFVRRVFNLPVDDHNKADAICLATYGEALARFNGIIPPALEVR